MSADFIKTVSEIHRERFLLKVQNLIRNKIPCGFFMGFFKNENISDIINNLKNSGFNITCICCIDANQAGGGAENLNLPLVTLDEFPNFNPKPPQMLYFSSLKDEIFAEYFSRYGVNMFSLANADYTENLYNFYIQQLPELYKVYEMLADEESKKVFLASIKGKLTGQVQDFRFAPEPQYFLEGFLPTEGDIAIDGGAFDGATARDFTIQGAKVYAFEMDSKNYQNCLPRAEKYNFVIENLGLSNQEGQEFYFQSGAGSGKGRGDIVGNFIDLDTYVLKKNLPRVDYIKLDIEGAELDMLHGAAKTIARWKPKMAVSAYHKPEDLWTLATYIKSLRPDYEFKFRHYALNFTKSIYSELLKFWGLNYLVPSRWEMVLYCR